MKKIIAVWIAVLMLASAVAFAEEAPAENRVSTGFKLTMKDGGLMIIGYEGEDVDVIMPSEINGLQVTGIVAGAFAGTAITSIVVPETVAVIEDGAFTDCASLISVTINSPVCAVNAEAFTGCGAEMTINLVEGSPAQTMAEQAGITYALIPGASEAVIGGADGPTSIIVAEEQPAEEVVEATAEPAAEEAPAAEGGSDPVIGGGLLIPEASAPEITVEPAAEVTAEPATEVTAEPATEATEAAAEIPSIGGGLVFPVIEATEEPAAEATAEPAAPAPEAPDSAPIDATLRSFHDFSGIMPVAYIVATEENSGYSVTYSCDDKVIDDYISIFPANDWALQDAGNDGVMTYTFVTSPDYSSMFYITRMLDGSAVTFVFDTSYDYGFDPVNGL